MKTISKKDASFLFRQELEPGIYEISHTVSGGLVVGGFTEYGMPVVQEFSYKTLINVVEDEYLDHGNGD